MSINTLSDKLFDIYEVVMPRSNRFKRLLHFGLVLLATSTSDIAFAEDAKSPDAGAAASVTATSKDKGPVTVLGAYVLNASTARYFTCGMQARPAVPNDIAPSGDAGAASNPPVPGGNLPAVPSTETSITPAPDSPVPGAKISVSGTIPGTSVPLSNVDAQLMAGAGDVVIVIGQDDYKRMYSHSMAGGKLPYLYINGIGLGTDGKLVAQLPCAPVVYLRFAVRQGPPSKEFWASLYATSGLTGEAPLNPGIAWDNNGPVSVLATGPTASIAVTTGGAVTTASAVVLALLFLSGWIFTTTDTFRDAPAPWWLVEAKRLRSDAVKLGLQIGTTGWIQKEFPAFNSAYQADYQAESARVRAGILPDSGQEQDALYGLLLDSQAPPNIRATYSLARTQLGMWFMFAVSAGIFLWIAFGQLPRIDGSLLVLLGLSVSTAGVSLAIDKTAAANNKRPFTISTNLLTDIVIGGTDDKQQVYRYQAVVVNLLLLFVGVINVVQNLSYPLFDPTWLAFLGVSGVALTLGKQVNET